MTLKYNSTKLKIICDEISKVVDSECILVNNPLKTYTTFKIGGICPFFLKISSKDLPMLLKKLKKLELSYKILGNGSNLLVSDNLTFDCVIKISDDKIRMLDNGILECDAGVKLPYLAGIALKNNLSGLEFAQGIPASIGGAILMNAGAYHQSISDCVLSIKFLDNNMEVSEISNKECNFGYRKSYFSEKPKFIILSTKLQLKSEDPELIREKMNTFTEKRGSTQPLDLPSAGSIFKHPTGHFAGKLIEDAGLKGYTIGGAQISPKHAGFIINIGDAKADDVKKLIEFIKNTIMNNYGIQLEEEIKYWD